ncbi:MAG: virulence RhuM family protein [Geobacter sp.]
MTEQVSTIQIYQDTDGKTALEVKLDQETVWLTQKQMAMLFGKTIPTVNEHIKNTFKEGELEENAVIRNFRITAADGKQYDTAHYNLNVIISVGYRVKSQQGTRFRIWATQTLKDQLSPYLHQSTHQVAYTVPTIVTCARMRSRQ